jgi:hypothetical protein
MRYALLLTALLLAASTFAQQTDDLFVPQGAAPRVIIPVAGNAAGSNGTYFRSDINLINFRSTTQRVLIYWLPQGVAGPTLSVRAIDMAPSSGLSSEDFVNEVLNNRTGVGTIEFVGVLQDGTFDPAALLHATSRIWTPRPDGAPGTMSQTFPAIVGDQTPPTAMVKTLFGLRRTSQYRLNIGMNNPSNGPQLFRVTVAISGSGGTDTQTFELTVQPRSIEQRLVGGTASGTVQVIFEDIGGGAGDWHAWASSVDNQSGDAWSQVAFASLVID